jgi:D-alanyl-D-alanine carboxypeptidase (penicillin-binding protein 5/6)
MISLPRLFVCSAGFCRPAFLLALLLALPAHAVDPAKESPAENLPPSVDARAALLYDPATETALFEKNIHTPYLPASTVKLLTALLVYERKGLSGSFVVEREDTHIEPSHIPLIAGETVKVRDLMYALLIGSDNDAAMALARYTAGSAPRFIQWMNLRADQLGCSRSQFKNPNGLPASGQYTTAADLLKIFQAVLAIPELNRICRTKEFYLTTAAKTQLVKNHNKLLGKYDGMGAAKTGWTYASRHTYAASCTRGGRTLHLVLLNSKNKWSDAELIFNYGFSHLPPLPSKKEKPSPTPSPTPEPAPPIITAASKKLPEKKVRPYTVRKGDTLYQISRVFGCTVEDLLQVNSLTDPDHLKTGEVVLIPQ